MVINLSGTEYWAQPNILFGLGWGCFFMGWVMCGGIYMSSLQFLQEGICISCLYFLQCGIYISWLQWMFIDIF